MSTFIGNIEAKTDQKGRIFIPAPYRKMLAEKAAAAGEIGASHVIMRRDADNACLVFYPEEVWNAKLESLKANLDEWDADDQMILMQFVSDAERLDIDAQGRVLIRKPFLQSIEAGSELLFVGMMDRFALWDKQKFAARRMSSADFATRLKSKMKPRPF